MAAQPLLFRVTLFQAVSVMINSANITLGAACRQERDDRRIRDECVVTIKAAVFKTAITAGRRVFHDVPDARG